jgi:hypothetical protein
MSKSLARLDAPAIGFRAFKWQGGALRSVGVNAEWPIQRGPQVAQCKPHYYASPHSGTPAPVENCTCGQHAYSIPEKAVGQIQAVVISYGKIIIAPDGWRAEKSEIIGLIAPKNFKNPSECKHTKRGVGSNTLVCEECGASLQQIELEATGEYRFTYGATTGFYQPHPQSLPSLSALEILAEQYGARVIQNWDDGIALAQEQGAKPIPEELHAEARKKASKEIQEQRMLVPPVWTFETRFTTAINKMSYFPVGTLHQPTTLEIKGTNMYPPGSKVQFSGQEFIVKSCKRDHNGEITIEAESVNPTFQTRAQFGERLNSEFSTAWSPAYSENALKKSIPKRGKKKKQLPETILRKREKREQHAKLWGPDSRAA